MRKLWQRFAFLGCVAFSLAIVMPGVAQADPIRLTVEFTVAGDALRDPDVGTATGSGAFSIVTNLGPGDRVTNLRGFGADQVSFSWGGTTWTRADADVLQIGFDSRGNVDLWNLSAFVPGDNGGMGARIFPDFSVTFCGFCGAGFQSNFSYTTARSIDRGIFQGQLTSFALTQSEVPAPIPEPASLLLVGGSLIAVARARAGRGRNCRH